ncbi:MAG: transposase family protein [Micropruina sp.]|uniref:transposase family protein n=1 Tax=Micropruina sp. TaxID=2737536 RepID=UPI0039E586D6
MPSSPKAGASKIERADDLMTALSTVPDPRDPRGVRYRLAAVLTVAVCAVPTKRRSWLLHRQISRKLGMSGIDDFGWGRMQRNLDRVRFDRSGPGS